MDTVSLAPPANIYTLNTPAPTHSVTYLPVNPDNQDHVGWLVDLRCIYHTRFGHCKFGMACSSDHYQWCQSCADFEKVLTLLSENETEITKHVKDKVNKLKNYIQQFFCLTCDYKVNSNLTLTTHTS